MSAAPPVLAICVNWNGREVLTDTLVSLQSSSYPSLRTVVVDNGSEDGSADLVPDQFELERISSNRGYGAGLNRVLGRYFNSSRSPVEKSPTYFLFLNNDVVLEPDLIDKLVEFAEKTGPGVYGPKVLRAERPTHLDAAWGDVTWSHVASRFHGIDRPDSPPFDRVRRVELLLGCVLLVHSKVIQEVGFFDEQFFMYHEEVDFLYRAGLRKFPCYYCPFARAYHRSAHSTRSRPWLKLYWVRRNAVYFLRKHSPGFRKWLRFGGTFTASLLYCLLLLRWKKAAVSVRAARDGWRMEFPAK